MLTDGQRLLLPGEAGVGHDDLQVREIDRHVIQIHRVRVFQPHPVAAAHPRPDAGLPGVEEGDAAFVLNRLVKLIGHPVVGVESLEGGMELETLDAELAHQTPRLPHAHLALPGVNGGEGDEDIGVFSRDLRDFLVLVTAVSRLPLRIDGEDHGGDVLFAVMSGGFRHGWRMLPRRAEIFRHRGLEVVITVIRVATAGFLRMGVDVDGADLFEVDHAGLLFHHVERHQNARSLPRADADEDHVVEPLIARIARFQSGGGAHVVF